MLAKRFGELDKSDIEGLVANEIPEGRTIEYKRDLPSNRDEDKKEFLADVSSFANASGGDLIFGIEEARDEHQRNTGIPRAAIGVSDGNGDQVKQRLENILLNGVEPRISGTQIKAISGFANGPVIVIRVPKSWAGPHMIKSSPRFFSRNSSGKAPLDVLQIRAAFLQSEELPTRIRRFREERIGNIIAGETPVALPAGTFLVLHLVPLSNFANGDQIDIGRFLTHELYLPTIGHTGSQRPNLDGYLHYASGRDQEETTSSGYSQIYRDGAIEAVAKLFLNDHGQAGDSIPSHLFEKTVVEGLESYLSLFMKLAVDSEIVLMLSLLGVRGRFMFHNAGQRVYPIDRDNLLLPDFTLKSPEVDVPAVLQPVFDLAWQACGLPRSPNYNGARWMLRD